MVSNFTRRHNKINIKYSFAPGIHALTFYWFATRQSPPHSFEFLNADAIRIAERKEDPMDTTHNYWLIHYLMI